MALEDGQFPLELGHLGLQRVDFLVGLTGFTRQHGDESEDGGPDKGADPADDHG